MSSDERKALQTAEEIARGETVDFWAALRFPDAWSALAGHLRRVH